MLKSSTLIQTPAIAGLLIAEILLTHRIGTSASTTSAQGSPDGTKQLHTHPRLSLSTHPHSSETSIPSPSITRLTGNAIVLPTLSRPQSLLFVQLHLNVGLSSAFQEASPSFSSTRLHASCFGTHTPNHSQATLRKLQIPILPPSFAPPPGSPS